MFARASHIILAIYLCASLVQAQEYPEPTIVNIEVGGGLFVGDGFGGASGLAGMSHEQGDRRYSVRFARFSDAKAPNIQGPPTDMDYLDELSILVGYLSSEGPGDYGLSIGPAMVWGRHDATRNWETFRKPGLTFEAFGSVRLVEILRLGLLARANYNSTRAYASINAVVILQVY